jgi:hypothetical protein
MSKKNNNTLLIVAAFGVGGYFLWKHSQNQIAAPVQTIMPVTTSSNAIATSPVQVTATTDDPRVIEIQKWIATIPQPQMNAWNAALSVMTSAEKDGLYDIVLNDFYGNGITTSGQRVVWDTLRAKYKIP